MQELAVPFFSFQYLCFPYLLVSQKILIDLQVKDTDLAFLPNNQTFHDFTNQSNTNIRGKSAEFYSPNNLIQYTLLKRGLLTSEHNRGKHKYSHYHGISSLQNFYPAWLASSAVLKSDLELSQLQHIFFLFLLHILEVKTRNTMNQSRDC